jgi:uncharacterized protein HemY
VGEAKVGDEFIKHEFNEAIAIQQSIVEAARQLSEKHPFPAAKRDIKSMLRQDERQLTQLQKLGKPYGATGEVEDVAKSMKELAESTVQKASEAESEAYEAHAVLLSLKRKQQDSAGSVLKIARALKQPRLRDAAKEMQKKNKEASEKLAKTLSDFSVVIATKESAGSY